MNRFKFRVWEVPLKRYLDWNQFNHHLMWFDKGELRPISALKPQDYIIEQFTGFKDRDGREIYEGDILGRTGYVQLTVDWSDGRFIGRNKTFGCEVDFNKNLAKDFEIVGNIHDTH